MNLSENDSSMYLETYDYEPTCEMGLSPELPDGARVFMVLCYVMFGLGLLGMFKKGKRNMYLSLSTCYGINQNTRK